MRRVIAASHEEAIQIAPLVPSAEIAVKDEHGTSVYHDNTLKGIDWMTPEMQYVAHILQKQDNN